MSRIRREGFSGQHLVVVPEPVRAEALRHPLLKNLLVTDAGYYPLATGHRVERPQGASTHLLILCLRGRGWVKSLWRTLKVAPGDLVWLPADGPHAYGATESDPWKIIWTHFCGTDVAAWREELGWATQAPIGQFHFDQRRVGTLGLEKVYAHLEAGYSTRNLLGASTALRNAFCVALELMSSAGARKTADERTAAVRGDITADPARPHRLEEMATSAGLSVPHFSVLFRRQTGYSPIDFVIRQRIRRACRLLDGDKHSIAEVASEVGFSDAYYFSRCFRAIMSVSPRDYRAVLKG